MCVCVYEKERIRKRKDKQRMWEMTWWVCMTMFWVSGKCYGERKKGKDSTWKFVCCLKWLHITSLHRYFLYQIYYQTKKTRMQLFCTMCESMEVETFSLVKKINMESISSVHLPFQRIFFLACFLVWETLKMENQNFWWKKLWRWSFVC